MRAGCPFAVLVQRASDIDWPRFVGIERLGVTAGASAPEALVEEVIDAFAERFAVRGRDGHDDRGDGRVQPAAPAARAGGRVALLAVYTDFSDEEFAAFMAGYDLGPVLSVKGIAEGVENSNYLLATRSGQFILTLYEKRVDAADLPFFLGLMEHLAAHGINCPLPVADRSGSALGRLSGRPAAIVTFLSGLWVRRPRAEHCAAVGKALAELHLAGEGFSLTRRNALSVSGWRPLFEMCDGRADEVAAAARRGDRARARSSSSRCWPRHLPQGVIHADLFPDNVFFLNNALSGLIDFYFACNDMLAYDVAVCINAWCFEPDVSLNVTKARGLLANYAAVRPLSPDETAALPLLCRGAALRFLLTRLYDWLTVPDGALVVKKDPLEYYKKLRFHRGVGDAARLRPRPVTEKPRVSIWTDGACSGNPGPGGWGAILVYKGREKELKGGEALTTNNRMELMAAIAALEAMKRPAAIDFYTDSQYLRGGVMGWIEGWKRNGWRTADKKPVKNADLWQRLDDAAKRHDIVWHWVRGHAGTVGNERADELAREGMKPFKPKRADNAAAN